MNPGVLDIVPLVGGAVALPGWRSDMKHKLFSASCLVAIAVIGTAPAYADPVGHGNTCGSAGQTSTPGNSASSPGSPFNESGTNSMNGGKGGQAYTKAQLNNKVGATAQYDTACKNVTQNGSGTPAQTLTTVPTQVPNNSIATRIANG